MHIKNYEKYQHYTDGRPMHWIKVMKNLIDDRQWDALSGDAAKLLIGLWLLATEGGGVLPDMETTAFRLRTDPKKISKLLDELVHWIVCEDIDCTKPYETVPDRCLDKSRLDIDKIRQEEETESVTLFPVEEKEDKFSQFWEAYPICQNKDRKEDARKKWKSRKLDKQFDAIMAGLEKWKHSKKWSDPQYIHNPANWIQATMWNEEPQENPGISKDSLKARLMAAHNVKGLNS